MMSFLSLAFHILLFLIQVSNGALKEEIHIGAFLTNIQDDVHCFKSAMEAAMNLINKDATLLPNHELVIHFIDNFGTAGFGITQFFKLREKKPVLQVLLGPFIEQDSVPIRQLAASLKLPQVEEIDETHEKRRKALMSIFNHFEWNEISLLYDYEYFNLIENAEKLKEDLVLSGFETPSFQGFSSAPQSNAYDQMKNLKKQDARIITVDMDMYAVPMIFCDAHLNNMSTSKHVFLSGNVGLSNDYWHLNYLDSRCKPEDVGTAADGFISLARSNFRLDGKISRSGKSKSEIWELIKYFKRQNVLKFSRNNAIWKKSKRNLVDVRYYEGSTRMFDLVYRVAIAFDNLLKTRDSKHVLMQNYYDDRKYQQIVKELKNVQFEGITGNHRHSDVTGGDSERDYIVKQYKNGKFLQIGYFTSSNESLVIYEDKNIFKDGVIPNDKLSIKRVALTYSTWLVHSMWIMATIGILLSIVLFYTNNRYRNKRVVKMSSPNINNCIIVGCILCYMTVIFYGMDARYIPMQRTGKMCDVIVITLSIGFTLSFGSLFTKTWRVYKIFSAARQNKKMVLRDYHLYGMIFLLLVIDVILLSMFLTLSPFQLHQSKLKEKLDITRDVLDVSVINQCNCAYRTHFLSIIISYKVILLLFGLFMAWETRNVNIPVLNDAKHIGIAVYTVSVIAIVGALCASALTSSLKYAETYFVVSLSICLATTITLLLMFLPKMELLFDKDGAKQRRSISSISSNSFTAGFHTHQHSRKFDGDQSKLPREEPAAIVRSFYYEAPCQV